MFLFWGRDFSFSWVVKSFILVWHDTHHHDIIIIVVVVVKFSLKNFTATLVYYLVLSLLI